MFDFPSPLIFFVCVCPIPLAKRKYAGIQISNREKHISQINICQVAKKHTRQKNFKNESKSTHLQ